MGKSTLFMLAIIAGYPAWGTGAKIAILLGAGALLAGGIAVRALKARPKSWNDSSKQDATSQKVSNALVALSSAAILAVYAAGYHRTGSAAYRFEVQEARLKESARITTISEARVTPVPSVPAIPPPPAPPIKKDNTRHSSATARKTPPSDLTVPAAAEEARRPKLKNGTFLGWGRSLHGDIQASVVIRDGQIISTAIAQCLTRYSCSWIADLPDQTVARQSEKIDFVSGATESSEAFSDAVADALARASE